MLPKKSMTAEEILRNIAMTAEDNALTVAAFHEAFHLISDEAKRPLYKEIVDRLIDDNGYDGFADIFGQRYVLYCTETEAEAQAFRTTMKEIDGNGDVTA